MTVEFATKAPSRSEKSTSQTLDRGIRVLELLAQLPAPASVAELAAGIDVDRAVLYRLLRTLAARRLVARDASGRYRLGMGLLVLSSHISGELQRASRPELTRLATDLGATAFLTVEDEGEAVCLDSVEPRNSNVHVAYRPGLRHPLNYGASSVALLAGRPRLEGEHPEITKARLDGYAISQGQVQPGTLAVAAPVRVHGTGEVIASVAIVSMIGSLLPETAAQRVLAAADAISRSMG